MNSTPSPPAIRIVLLSGPRLGDGVAVPPQGAFIGRSRGSLIVLDHEAHRLVSGHHLAITLDDGWWAEDLKSTNGTWRNGARLAERSQIAPDDEFELGRPGLEGTLRFYVTFVDQRRALFGVADA
jgi:pSer/pThr/pTyr-binding forkhead associated (FHA) protein